jgi:hypothetical protein
VGYAAWIEEVEMHAKYLFENLVGRDHLEDLPGDERIILKWI